MKQGVLLINLGTPAAPTTPAVRSYQHRFLADPRVINLPRFVWLPILNLMVLPKRPSTSAAMYRQIWSQHHGSPLAYYTQKQAAQLMEKARIEKLTIIPLYPQYSTTTIGSVIDDINRFYFRRAQIPELHIINGFTDRDDYLDLLAKNINVELDHGQYDQVIMSFHGIPVSYAQHGDPYPQQCATTMAGVKARLHTDVSVMQTYQSKFGPAKWLTPATADTLKYLPQKGVKRVLVVSPAFVADCLETLYELDIENRAYFMDNGGQVFHLLPCFNDDPSFTKILRNMVVENNG